MTDQEYVLDLISSIENGHEPIHDIFINTCQEYLKILESYDDEEIENYNDYQRRSGLPLSYNQTIQALRKHIVIDTLTNED